MAYAPLPDAPTFSMAPPKAPPVADFGFAFAQDPMAQQAYQFRLAQGQKGIERSAAARGSLLTGGTLKALTDYNQGAASQEYGNAYNRALQTYDVNRETGQLNFGNANSAYDRSRSAFEGDRGFSLDRARIEDARRRAEEDDRRFNTEFDYRKTRDAVGDTRYTEETGYAHGRDAMGDARYANEFDYRKGRDAAGDARYASETGYAHGRDTLGDQRYADELTYGRGRDAAGDARYASETGYAHGRDATADARYADELAYGRARTAWLDNGGQGAPYGSAYPAPGLPGGVGGKPRFSLSSGPGAYRPRRAG